MIGVLFMKKLVVLLICFVFLLSSCFLIQNSESKEPFRYLDLDKTTMIESTFDDSLIENLSFNDDAETESISIKFSSLVVSFKYQSFVNGTFSFSCSDKNANIDILVHTGSILGDNFISLPCTEDLNAGYEYTIEVMAKSTSMLGKTYDLEISAPATKEKNISNCISFTDFYDKGETLYYQFTPKKDGYYNFSVENNNTITLFENGKNVDQTGWGSYGRVFEVGNSYTFKVIMKSSISSGKIKGRLLHPANPLDVSNILKENGGVIIKFNPYYKNQTMKISFIAPNSHDYIFSTNDMWARKTNYSSKYEYKDGVGPCKYSFTGELKNYNIHLF